MLYEANQEVVEEAKALIVALCEKTIGDDVYYTITAMKSIADSLTDILDKRQMNLFAIAAI